MTNTPPEKGESTSENRASLKVPKLLLVLGIAFSLTALPGSYSSLSSLPHVPLASASLPVTVPNSPWYPAGPTMNTETVNIFRDQSSELNALCSGAIDLTDFPLPNSPILQTCPNVLDSPPVSANSYFEIQFNLANNYWGVPFQFGNNASGVQIRQGIAHLVDKAKFASTVPSSIGPTMAVDDPVPSSDGLPAANPCAWDAAFPQSGGNCTVGAPGGTSYHIAPVSGLCGNETVQSACQLAWMPGFASPDFCAAAQHFVNSGLATGRDSNCVLTGLNLAPITSHPVDFFVRNTEPRQSLGTGLSEEICALFTGAFTVGCTTTPGVGCLHSTTTSFPPNAVLCVFNGTVAQFPGLVTSTKSNIFEDWWIYTGGFVEIAPFDQSLYNIFNSIFASNNGPNKGTFGVGDIPPCNPSSVPTSAANDYMYNCITAYDAVSNQIELAPCISTAGDPSLGQIVPTFANCPGTSKLTAISAGYQSEDVFGKVVVTIPIYSNELQFAYQSNWSRVINAQGIGIPNYFTWLNAYSTNPAIPGTIRQGFDQTTNSLNPYSVATVHDFYVLNNIYDSLYRANPLGPTQIIDWMVLSDQVLNNTQLGYAPPAGTTVSIRATLRNGLSWHDQAAVTSWDVKFSFLTLSTCSACLVQIFLSPVVDVHILGPSTFDINLRSIGPFTKLGLGSPPILPGRHWSLCGTATWDADVAAGTIPKTCMAAPSSLTSTTFDPLAAGILIGSGPWMCKNPTTGVIGEGCSSTGLQNPPAGGSYTLTRFGAGSTSRFSSYFRGSSNLALWTWTSNTGGATADFLNISTVANCFNKPVGTIGCTRWQVGIGNPGNGHVVGFLQVSEVASFFGVGWTAPFNWTDLTGIGAFPPILYEGSVILNPCNVDPVNGYNC